MIDNKKIIVSMTSWEKRIGNVATVVKSLINQKLEPDVIQLNLSEEEFPGKEKCLPGDLISILNDKKLHIEWVKGNDKAFKKIIPTLKKYYGEDYYLLSVDDDWVYRSDYVGMMVDYIEQYKSDSFCLSTAKIIGNRTIYKSSVFKEDFWEKLTDEVILALVDDAYIEHYLKSKGKKMANYRPSNVFDIIKPFNQIFPNARDCPGGHYETKKVLDAIKKIDF